MIVTYVGERRGENEIGMCRVWRIANGLRRPFSPRSSQRVFNHSPDGFEWGYGGSGPAQLALALCLDSLAGDRERALDVYQAFKWRVVGRLGHNAWNLSQQFILETIAQLEAERKGAA